MDANWNINPYLLDNQYDNAFNNNFFHRFPLRYADKALSLTDTITKNYLFPTYYSNVSCSIAVFMCNYDKAMKIMLDPLIKPVRMPGGRALITFSCYEYRNVLGMDPYNEIAISIPVMVNPRLNIPVLPVVLNGFKKFGYHIISMPVTSYENKIRGLKLWGLPKVVQKIDISFDGQSSICRAYESSGDPYFSLSVDINKGKKKHFDVKSYLYTRLEKQLLQSEINFKGDFTIVKNMDLLLNKNKQPHKTYLKISDSPSGQMLKKLEIEPYPFQFRYTPNMNSSFDLPNKAFKPPIYFDVK
jgi:hypothetical protein